MTFLQKLAVSTAGMYYGCFRIFFFMLAPGLYSKFRLNFRTCSWAVNSCFGIDCFHSFFGPDAAFGTVLFLLLRVICNIVLLVFFASPAIHFLRLFVSFCKGPVLLRVWAYFYGFLITLLPSPQCTILPPPKTHDNNGKNAKSRR